MFAHLTSEEFVNLMEGIQLPARRKAHLDCCASCGATRASMLAIRADINSLHTDVPEPDWAEFRSSVRNELLSRSIKRDSSVRRWTGWTVRPAAAWVLSLLLAIGITSGAFLWNMQPTASQSQLVEAQQADVTDSIVIDGSALPGSHSLRSSDLEAAKTVWSKAAFFDDLVQLGDAEEDQLRAMLESAQNGMQVQQ